MNTPPVLENGRPVLVRLGVAAWSIVGIVLVLAIAVAAVTAIGDVALPLFFAVVLGAIFRPAARWLESHRVSPSVAAAVVVALLVAAVVVSVYLTVHGVLDQVSNLGDQFIAALAEFDLTGQQLADAEAAFDDLVGVLGGGLFVALFSSFDVVGLATGAVIGSFVVFYLLRDAGAVRRRVVGWAPTHLTTPLDEFVGEAVIILRGYAGGRAVLSALVAVTVGVAALLFGLPLVLSLIVVNFVGGFIPYIGAVLGGGLAVVVALSDGGVPTAVAMLIVVLAANVLLENIVEPRVMGARLRVHPAVVLLVTALGGVVGGIVGLTLAVPVTLIGLAFFRRISALAGVASP